jgi:hypothetical protein
LPGENTLADVATTLAQWSTTASSNSPADATTVGSGLGDNLRTIQAVTRAYLSHYNSSAIASASTTDLGANTGLIQEISGTTTITGLGTVSAGIWKIVRFQGALTLTYNATSLILPTAANITTVAGDFMLAYSKGSGNWVVPFYFRGSGAPLTSGKGTAVASATTTDIWSIAGDYVHITGTTTITGLGTAPFAGAERTVVFDDALTLTHNATSLILPGGANITTAANDRMIVRADTTANMVVVSYTKASGFPVKRTLPTRQIFTSGSGTYTTPSGATVIYVRMIGGGGGGAGSGSSFGAGGDGGDTTFGTLTAGKGSGASASPGSSGAGGTGTNGDINITGGAGGNGGTNNTAPLLGASGGVGFFGGSGQGGTEAGAGIAAKSNTGGGGGGAGKPQSLQAGGGGGAGAYVEKLITSPSASYSYAIGAAGTAGSAGTSGFAGGAGGSGLIIVDEYYY